MFKTIQKPSEGYFKDKGSKFLAYAYPAYSEEEVKSLLEKLKAEHPKATHHCYAFRLGTDKNLFRANDDGEPSGSAGKPILGQIDSFGLDNTFVVVVRYYGGTKLGVSGLIHAYREAANLALEQAEIIEKETFLIARLSFGYESMNQWMQFVKESGFDIILQEFEQSCEMVLRIPDSSHSEFVAFAKDYPSTKIEWQEPYS